MSYADIAGLPLVAGLYTDFAPLIAYAFVGSSKQIAVGPVAIISLLVYQSIPLCNKLCAENNGVNATVLVRFKRKVNTTITETLSLSLARYLSLCLSLYSLSLTHTVCVTPMTPITTKVDDVHTSISDNLYILHTDSCSLRKVSKQMHCYANARLQP
jgi:hypothetical protein